MHPILFRIGEFPVGSYALMALLGLAAGCALFSWLAGRDGHSRMAFVELGLWAFIIALLSSKIFGALVDFDPNDPLQSLKKILRFGGHYYIGVIAGVTFLVIAFRRLKVPFASGLDYLAPALALAHGIGRIGCFLAGCCWGATCDLPWAVTFTSPDAHLLTGVPLNVALHPTQLYEATAEILAAGVLLFKHVRLRGRPGTTFLLYVVMYGVVRFGLEFVREDPRGTFLGRPTSQPLAIATAVLATILLVVMSRRSAPVEAPAGGGSARRRRRS